MVSAEELPANVQEVHRLLGKRTTLYDLQQLISRSSATASSTYIQGRLEAILRASGEPGWWWAALTLEQRKKLVDEVLPEALKAEGRKAREEIRISQLFDDIGGVKHYVRGKHNDAFSKFIGRLTTLRTRTSIPPTALLVELAPSEQKLLEEELEAKPFTTFEQALQVAVEDAGEQAALHEDWAPLDDSALPTTYSQYTLPPSKPRSRSPSQSRSPHRDRLWSPPPPRGPEYSEYALAHPLAGLTERQAARYRTIPAAWAARVAGTAFL